VGPKTHITAAKLGGKVKLNAFPPWTQLKTVLFFFFLWEKGWFLLKSSVQGEKKRSKGENNCKENLARHLLNYFVLILFVFSFKIEFCK